MADDSKARRRFFVLAWGALVLSVLAAVLLAQLGRPQPARYASLGPKLHSVRVADTDRLAQTLQLTGLLDALKAGTVDDVPRLAITRIPDGWTDIEDSDRRKTLFIASVLPLVLAANETIIHDRKRLLSLKENSTTPSRADRAWLQAMARRYRTEPDNLDSLLTRVDTVPPSLAVAQAAVESGWGTSRFARQGNALFGQWTWKEGAGLKPKQARQGLGNYAVKRYNSLYASVADYMRNLNTQKSYAEFRRMRAHARAKGQPPRGPALAAALHRYSEEGKGYVRKLTALIGTNSLGRLDKARLTP